MSSQKFIGRNRAPRVQIQYDVELYGADKTVQLPFVMGVMSDLSGNAGKAQPPVAERKYLEIEADTFDDRLKAMEPRVKMQVPNKLTGEGDLGVDLTFEKLDDFSPAAIARAVPALRQLLEARMQLANLITYMDGKTGAEELIAKILADPTLLQSLAAAPKPAEEASSSEDSAEE
jgi:type VI secretion system protein ImpB